MIELIQELEELLQDVAEWEEDDTPLSKESIKYAIAFVEKSPITQKAFTPDIEVHPDGEVALTWRAPNHGIINVAFNNKGFATWAAYLLSSKKQKFKGRFKV